MNNILFLISALFTFVSLYGSLYGQHQTHLQERADKEKMQAWVDSVYKSMSFDEKIGQLFMPVVETNNGNKPKLNDYICNQKVGGLLLSKGTLSQQAELINYAQSVTKIPLFIAADAEWGLSMRLSDAPDFPKNMVLGAITNDTLLYLYGKEVARQCHEMGIHINFAPTIDVNSNPQNPVIGIRAFGSDPENVARKGIAYAKGLEDNGVMAVAKHFPGHGDTSEDSHKTLPTIRHSSERLNEVELIPFRKYIEGGLSGIMIGHLNVPALNTNGTPASLSPNIGEKLLKQEMGFGGLIFTDGMAMRGVAKQSDLSVKAILAGNDIILGVPHQANELESVKAAIAKGIISEQLVEEKVRKILSYKYILGVHNFKPIDTAKVYEKVNTPGAEWLKRKLYDNAVTLLKNKSDLIPINELDAKIIASIVIGETTPNEFQRMLKKYDNIRTFQLSDTKGLEEIEKQVSDCNLLILSIHGAQNTEDETLQKLIKSKNTILVFFTSPYELEGYKTSIENAQAVVLAQDNNPAAAKSAAQGIFGGIPLKGKLQVSAANFPLNTGIETTKTRLAYNLPEEVGIRSETLAGIEEIAREGITNRAYPGCQILIAKEGVVIYEKSFGKFEYGISSVVTDETVYDLASVTKATATLPAVMKLYDQKKIQLQDPLRKFVPETRGSNKANITIRELLFHESGIAPFIPYYTSAIDKNSYVGPLFGSKSETYPAYYAGAWGRTDYRFRSDLISNQLSDTFDMPVAKDMYASKKMHDVLLKDIIDTQLGSRGKYTYSCLNFMLLKEAIENISGEDLNTFVQENFYRKLGASTTTFQPIRYLSINDIPPTENDPFFRKQLVRGYVHDEGAALFGGISGNAGLFSNANDMAKIYQMWLNEGKYGGERFLSKETVRLFTTTKSNVSRRGLGFDKPDPQNPKASPCGKKTPSSVYGHTGFTGTCFWVDPENQLIYIFLSNRVYPSRTPNKLSSMEIRERIQDEIYNAFTK
ncbi:glycoside hydrolase family 3 N-terminal domain-containing protein [Anaerorudis cellulosivorans]|uniref:glycoside hydrolase family 3 N-terminal domain-containing protein n=1 Tax=Anaerorudis cellulosivorans TaxID=3397862 RepID=UPI00221FC0AF|nr:glycoside hydrolase family 3 N-terminal domain-containing protein [Seramator thermalis]MCW1734467.1 serine hydrolase [Seramator thermalis]